MKKIIITSLFLFFTILFYAQEVSLELFKDGFSEPLSLQHANDTRLFVLEKGGKIRIIQPNGTVATTPFLDISAQITTNSEQGLLGLAFHPEYATNGYFYVNYTDINGNTKISRFSVDTSNPDLARNDSEVLILTFTQPFPNHNGGNLVFGPDGYLYISSGDGGGSGDPNNQAQNINSFLGKLLRIDINNPSGGNNYGIPPTNPFLGNPNAKKEIYAYGLRNPWRFSIDAVENNIWIADVGQNNIEEINKAPLSIAGINYGWRCYEGNQPFNNSNCPPESQLEFPFAEYSHNNGNCSITGGNVYRGNEWLDFEGLYFFADFCSGNIGTVDNSGNITNHGNFTGNWVSFGEDINKELYIVDLGGKIYKIIQYQIGTDNFSIQDDLSIYPNPTSENINFVLKRDYLQKIYIFDVTGSLVISEENISSDKKSILVETLSSGVYFAKVTSKTGFTFIKKIMIH